MNLQEKYEEIYRKGSKALLSVNYEIDLKIEDPTDNRFGLSLILRPDSKIIANIQKFLVQINALEPDQYYYPDSDFHITILSIISCTEGFDLNQIDIQPYINCILKSVAEITEIEISLKGVTVSAAALLIQGFPQNDFLEKFRNNLRQNFKKTKLIQSIDARYSITTAHITVARFKAPIHNSQTLLQTIDEFRNHNFGTLKSTTLSFMYNDWYQRKDTAISLAEININSV